MNSLFECEENNVFNKDSIELLSNLPLSSVDLLLTDIPYEKVNKSSNGLRIIMPILRASPYPPSLHKQNVVVLPSNEVLCH